MQRFIRLPTKRPNMIMKNILNMFFVNPFSDYNLSNNCLLSMQFKVKRWSRQTRQCRAILKWRAARTSSYIPCSGQRAPIDLIGRAIVNALVPAVCRIGSNHFLSS